MKKLVCLFSFAAFLSVNVSVFANNFGVVGIGFQNSMKDPIYYSTDDNFNGNQTQGCSVYSTTCSDKVCQFQDQVVMVSQCDGDTTPGKKICLLTIYSDKGHENLIGYIEIKTTSSGSVVPNTACDTKNGACPYTLVHTSDSSRTVDDCLPNTKMKIIEATSVNTKLAPAVPVGAPALTDVSVDQ